MGNLADYPETKAENLVGKKIAFAKFVDYERTLVLKFDDGTHTVIYTNRGEPDPYLEFIPETDLEDQERLECGFLTQEEYEEEKRKQEKEREQREYQHYLGLKVKFEGRSEAGLKTSGVDFAV